MTALRPAARRLALLLLLPLLLAAPPALATVSTTTRSASYTGNGSSTAYNFTFPVIKTSHLMVKVAGVTKTSGVDYTVTLVGGGSLGGTVTFASAPTSGASVTLERSVPQTQDLDLSAYGPFDPEALERALDWRAMVEAQNYDALTAADTALAARTSALEAEHYSANGAVSVVATGTTTPRTLAARAADVLNVKDFGAVGNNLADDTTAVQAAIDAASSAGGGTVFLPPGTYLTRKLTLRSQVYLRGAGPLVTTLRLASGQNTNLLEGENYASLTGTTSALGVYQWGLFDLTLNGNSGNNATSGNCLTVYGYGFTLSNVVVNNCRGYGIVSQWAPLGTLPGGSNNDMMESHVSNLKVHDTYEGAVLWDGPHDSVWQGVVAYNACIGKATGSGCATIWTKARGAALVAHGVHAWGGSPDYAFLLDGYALLTNSQGEGSKVAQVLVRDSNTVITGGDYFAAIGNESVRCIQVGDSGTSPIKTVLRTRVRNCWSGGVDVTYSGGGDLVDVQADQTSGSELIGTPKTDSYYNVRARLASASFAQFPGRVGRLSFTRKSVAFLASMPLDASGGNSFVVDASSAAAVTLQSPSNGYTGQRILVRIRNTSGGALGALTWGALYKMATWVQPASGFSRAIEFEFDGTNWVETFRSSADVPN